MDNLDDTETTAKISDSAYSNSCSNSQSRSHSSKSTHSGSHSSGSSGYGGKPSTSGYSNSLGQPPEKRSKEKDTKKKKHVQIDSTAEVHTETECRAPELLLEKEAAKVVNEVVKPSSPADVQMENAPEKMDIQPPERNIAKEDGRSCSTPHSSKTADVVISRPPNNFCSDGFSCVISMHDGVVMYTTSSLTTSLGFPKEMWIGRSFIDFIHPRDRNTFSSQITSRLAAPKSENGTKEKAAPIGNSTMVCRIRRYRSLSAGFGIKERVTTFLPFLLKLSFKDESDEEGKVIYLVIQATPFFSAFKVPNETVINAVPFIMRHSANGILESIDPDSIPYLGYMPQDMVDQDALLLYHPEDLVYLRQVYEAIVKEGRLPRSKTYRMLAQNGDYVKLETEWSAYINPWSRKLEFVTGRHHIIEGPTNPDVFQTPEVDKNTKKCREDIKNNMYLRESIVIIMNKVLTKSAEVAKLQMSKRCQDLASFMETLIEEQPKTDEELRLEIQDPDNSCYERDSVMLGGISPHHEHNDSKSSTETPLSYNQLNYNETLQRYFDSHQPHSFEDYHTANGENILSLEGPKPLVSKCLSPMALNSGDSMELTSSCESSITAGGSSTTSRSAKDRQQIRLTEALITKHNADMEKELVKIQRENRPSSKGEREKASNETRQKKKEHLARCNATFQPTPLMVTDVENQPHGVKRASKQMDTDSTSHKHHCTSARKTWRRQSTNSFATPSTAITTTVAANQWTSPVNNMNGFILAVGLPQQISIMGPVAMPGTPVFPLYYTTAAGPPIPSTSDMPDPGNNRHFQQPTVPCMMYGQAVYGSPFMYSPINPQVPCPMNQHNTNCPPTMLPLGLASSNYEEACKPNISMRSKTSGVWKDKQPTETQSTSSKMDQGSAANTNSSSAMNLSKEEVRDMAMSCKSKSNGLRHSEEAIDRTDGESSYSSFYSSFFRTESGSAEESGDARKHGNKSKEEVRDMAMSCKSKSNGLRQSEEAIDRTDGESSYSSFYSSFFRTESGSAEESGDARKHGNKSSTDANSYCEPKTLSKVARMKMEPPWMDQVCVTSELIYKYQVTSKSKEEVLLADKKKIMALDQTALVSEQLGQLYLDMQLEGVAARLTLEEGITSSSSSGEETSSKTSGPRKKRNYSKLVMIHEEDAPLPPPSPDGSTSGRPTPLSPPGFPS